MNSARDTMGYRICKFLTDSEKVMSILCSLFFIDNCIKDKLMVLSLDDNNKLQNGIHKLNYKYEAVYNSETKDKEAIHRYLLFSLIFFRFKVNSVYNFLLDSLDIFCKQTYHNYL